MLEEGQTLYAYRFSGYWKDVGTIESYWESNMELIKALPEFNLYEDFWKIYTNSDHQPPQYIAPTAKVKESLITDGSEIYGEVYHSVLGPNVVVKEGAVIRDSIIMGGSVIGVNTMIDRCIIDEKAVIGDNVQMGVGENIPNEVKPNIYSTGISVVGGRTQVPSDVVIGKNCVVYGNTVKDDYPNGWLESGKVVIREGGY